MSRNALSEDDTLYNEDRDLVDVGKPNISLMKRWIKMKKSPRVSRLLRTTRSEQL